MGCVKEWFDECPLRWRHNDHAGVSNHQPHGCLLNRLFRRKSKKTSKLRVTGLCAGNSPGTGEFPAQMASYAENVSIWWRHQLCGPLWSQPKTDTTSPLHWADTFLGKIAAARLKFCLHFVENAPAVLKDELFSTKRYKQAMIANLSWNPDCMMAVHCLYQARPGPGFLGDPEGRQRPSVRRRGRREIGRQAPGYIQTS